MAAFPLRAVYMEMAVGTLPDMPPVSILVSVPKRKLHHATDRNRMKRQIREAYRLAKPPFCQFVEARQKRLALAFICMSDKPCSSAQVRHSIDKLLRRIQEKMS